MGQSQDTQRDGAAKLHAHLLHMLGAASHEEAGGIIAKLHACQLAVQQGVQPDWWRKRADEIEAEVARTGSINAMRCYTDMRALLQSATHPTKQGLEQSEQRQLDIGKAIERACIDLPQGAELIVSLEKDAGTVALFDSNGNEFDHFNEDCETFAERINMAIDGAIAAEQVAAQAKQGG